MVKTVSIAPTSAPFISRNIAARVLLAEVDEPTTSVLHDCFKQFGIHTVSSNADCEKRLHKEKFEACVVPLGRADAEQILTAARNSASNSRIVIYGISRDTQEAMRYSKLGINAVISHPVERQSALKVVRSTHLLVVHELRRYVRLPVVAAVKVDLGKNSFTATTAEISAGGISMKTDVAFI